MTIVARQFSNVCYDQFGNAYRCNSGWNSWGRWVALGIILVGAFLLFFLFSCLTARRRRRAGRQPYYGTGWVGRTPFGHGQATYNPNYQSQQPNYNQNQYQTPPAYNQTGGYYGQNQGYFGGRQTEVEMQPPSNTYRGGEGVYEPPQGPPPAKK